MPLRLEQNSESLLNKLVNRHNQRGDIVYDPFCLIFTTCRACVLLSDHHRFSQGESEPDYKAHCMVQFVEVFTRHILNYHSKITGTPDSVQAALFLSKDVQIFSVRNYINVWYIPNGMIGTYIYTGICSIMF